MTRSTTLTLALLALTSCAAQAHDPAACPPPPTCPPAGFTLVAVPPPLPADAPDPAQQALEALERAEQALGK